ncbi:CU044_2847 family protein [Nostoc punctiforme UO1]|uniref:CU044_2847 family protein n=1 Tax=Nostoc punctiforme TaxID=272131 RepID=UPI0030A744D6
MNTSLNTESTRAVVASTSEIHGEIIQIYIEVDDVNNVPPLLSSGEDTPITRGGGVEKAIEAVGDIFGQGLELSRNCAIEVVHSLKKMTGDVKPNEFEVKLAIKLDSKAGIPALVKFGAEAQMEVTMKWTNQ